MILLYQKLCSTDINYNKINVSRVSIFDDYKSTSRRCMFQDYMNASLLSKYTSDGISSAVIVY